MFFFEKNEFKKITRIHDVFNERGKTLLVSKDSKTYPSRLQVEVLQYYKSIAWE